MKIEFLGIHHYDPIGRARLLACLQQLRASRSSLPDFVAVEYPQQGFEKLIRQRIEFESLVGQKFSVDNFPGIEPESVVEIASSFGYEGDTHRRVFPSAEVLWLPSECQVADDRPVTTLHILGNMFCRNSFREDSSEDVLSGTSKSVWRDCNWRDGCKDPMDNQDYKRDHLLADAIMARVKCASAGWAIVIVGAGHCADLPESAVNLVRKAGHSIVVTVLEWA